MEAAFQARTAAAAPNNCLERRPGCEVRISMRSVLHFVSCPHGRVRTGKNVFFALVCRRVDDFWLIHARPTRVCEICDVTSYMYSSRELVRFSTWFSRFSTRVYFYEPAILLSTWAGEIVNSDYARKTSAGAAIQTFTGWTLRWILTAACVGEHF